MNTPTCFSDSLLNSQLFDSGSRISASENDYSSRREKRRRSSFIKRNRQSGQATEGRFILPTEEPLRRIGDDEFLVVKRRETLRRSSAPNRPSRHSWHSLTTRSTPNPSRLRRSTMDMNLLITDTSGIGQQEQMEPETIEEKQHFRSSLVAIEKLYSLNFDDDALKSLITDVEKRLESK